MTRAPKKLVHKARRAESLKSMPLNELLGPQLDSVELSLREALRLVRAIDLISVHAETEREAMSAVAAQAEILLDEATAHMRAMSQRLDDA